MYALTALEVDGSASATSLIFEAERALAEMVAVNGETGVGKTAVGKARVAICETGAGGIEDCADTVTASVAMVGNECAASEAA